MGWRRRALVRGTVVTVLAPLAVVAALAAATTVGAFCVHAVVLHDGPWAWLGDAALVLDVSGGVGLLGVPAAVRREQAARSCIEDVDAMSGREFEARLTLLFADLGFAVTRTRASGDFGADLLLERASERAVVQAKRYDGRVGIEAVQQVIGATRFYDAAQALVVTNSTCTHAAAALATAHGVELVEREALIGLLAAHPHVTDRSSAVVLLAREVGGGVTLVLFAAGTVVRAAWWTARAALRACAVLWRAVR